jgi:hypothetical protein
MALVLDLKLLHCIDQVLDGGEDILVDILQSVFLVIVRKPIAMDDLHLLDERTFPRLSCPKQQKLQLFPGISLLFFYFPFNLFVDFGSN